MNFLTAARCRRYILPMSTPDDTDFPFIRATLRALGLVRSTPPAPLPLPGDAPKKPAPGAPPARVEVIEYGPGHCQRHAIALNDSDSLPEFLATLPPPGTHVRWINVDGIHDPGVLHALASFHDLHPLAMEDAVHTHQRPKAERYGKESDDAPLYVVMRMVSKTEDGTLDSEQVSAFLGKGLVITIQETPGDLWDPIRKRLEDPHSRLRARGADFLLYALIDGMVDGLFPMLDEYSDRIEELEEQAQVETGAAVLHAINALRRELMLLRRAVAPTRELARQLMAEPMLSEETHTYLRDVHDHAMQCVDLLEVYRDLAASLSETWLGMQGHRMNQVMKTLTLLTALFIPITFVSGVFGMNFEKMPLLKDGHGFAVFLVICGVMMAGMAVWFWRKKWL